LAIRLAVLLILTSSPNGLLKLIIKNPRPFVLEGTYLKKWAVSPQSARSLAAEYSTPSGHAMSASSFYSYLFASTRNRFFQVLAIAAILLIGFSRPYLGVHYVEDILIGWAAGLCCALLAIKYFATISRVWNRLSYPNQIGIAVTFSLALWLLSIAVNGGSVHGQSFEILSETGFLTGILIARPLELRLINFDPRSSSLPAKVLRVLITVILVTCTSLALNKALGSIASVPAMLVFVLQYLCSTAVGVVNIFLAPLLFTRIGLADPIPAGAD
jgi:hypothetical protein